MIPETVKEYLVPNTFGVLGYVCVVIHFICGIIFTAISGVLKVGENGNFFCIVDIKSPTYKKLFDQECLTEYNQMYSPYLPLYGFVLLSFGLPVLISVIYSLTVRSRVSEIESIQETSDDGNESLNYGKRTVYVFYCYIIHLAVRVLLSIVFTALQHTYFYSNGFDSNFICNYNSTSVVCELETGSEKRSLGIVVSVINSIVPFAVLVEVIYLSKRCLPPFNCCLNSNWSCDTQFVNEYFLRKQYAPVGSSLPLTSNECINDYRHQILTNRYNDFYTKLVIHTERAPFKFEKQMERFEIYDAYTEVPPDSNELKEVIDLFYPETDTNGKFPRSILAIGLPGIGKTALTKKIRRDWAEACDQTNPVYLQKIVFLFQLRRFNNLSEKFTLKNFLQCGTTLDSDKFACIYEKVIANPQAAIIVFDGLDELRTGNPTRFLDESTMIPSDRDTEMTAANLFVKLVLGDILNGATVVVTSRPTAAEFYSRFKFDRSVEIIGFTSEKIEEYVSQFCEKENIIKYKAKIWEQIHSSSELLSLCYIPLNCRIVCDILSECFRDSKNDDDFLLKTLTALYNDVLVYWEKHDIRKNIETDLTAEKRMTKLQQLAFDGLMNEDLVFHENSIDEEMRNSSLLSRLPNPRLQFATQFCFIHLTIQELLAARHVIQSSTPDKIKTFLHDHLQKSEWHLVIQFLAGLLGTEKQYEDCLWMLPESLQIHGGIIYLNDYEVFVMKCLREVDNEQIAQNVCETTVLNNVVTVYDLNSSRLTSNDWAAITYVCKHMKNLKNIIVAEKANEQRSVLKLLQNRCFNEVKIAGYEIDGALRALTISKCILNHEHAKLSSLSLHAVHPVDPQIASEFFIGGHARHLHRLQLVGLFSKPILEDSELLNQDNHAQN